MQITPFFDVFEAYRADLASADRAAAFGAHDGRWLVWGNALARSLALPVDARRRYLQAAGRDLGIEDTQDHAALVGSSMDVANDAEEHGAYATGTVILDLARALTPHAMIRLHGRLLSQQARILRRISDLDAAAALYGEVECMAVEHRDAELLARANLGLGVVARRRGNYPEARERFHRVLNISADSPAIADVHSLAHQGLTIAAGVAGDYSTALVHGWTAYEGAKPGTVHRLQMLLNIATTCLVAGYSRAALNGYLEILAGDVPHRTRLPAVGGAAVASANLGERRILEQLSALADTLLAENVDPYESADLERELAEAWFSAADVERAEAYRQRALARAARHGFFEIVHRAEQLEPRARRNEAPLPVEARRVSDILASADPHELMASVVVSRGGHASRE